MKPIYSRLTGIGPHKNTEIWWNELQSPAAILAKYGTGKTWLIESIPLALFGEGAWYNGSIYSALTQGGTGEGEVELIFAQDGVRYRAVRTIKVTAKTRTQHTILYAHDDMQLAGPKLTDFNAYIKSLIVDKDTFFATTFFGQNRRNDLCGTPGEQDLVARRRACFNDLIGAENLDRWESRCAEQQRKTSAVVSELEHQIDGERDWDVEIELQRMEATNAENTANIIHTAIEVLENELQRAHDRLKEVESNEKDLNEDIAKYEKADSDLHQKLIDLKALREECDKQGEIGRGLQEAEADRDAYRAHQERVCELMALRSAYNEYVEWRKNMSDSERELDSAMDMLSSLTSRPSVKQEMIDLADRLSATQADHDALIAEYDAKKKVNAEKDDLLSGLTSQRERLNEQCRAIRERIEKAPSGLFGDDCNPCPLMKDIADLPRQCEELEEKVQALTEQMSEIPDVEELPDVDESHQLLMRAKHAREVVDAERETINLIDIQRQKISGINETVSSLKIDPPNKIDNPQPEIDELNKAMSSFAGADERAKRCKEAQERAVEIDAKAHKLGNEIVPLQFNIEVLRAAAENAKKLKADRASVIESARADVEKVKTKLSTNRDELASAQRDKAAAETRVEELTKRRQENKDKCERLDSLRSEVEALKDLRTVFGPKGVRQILIDNAAPQLEEIADGLFEVATEGRMRLRISTQRVGSDGSSLIEDFQILIADRHGERDALEHSGGELKLIQILFRISVAIWIGKLHGQHPECLFLDEAFDQLGAEGTDDLLRMLEHLGDQIRLIVVVTHDSMVAERMASRIKLEKSVLGVALEVT